MNIPLLTRRIIFVVVAGLGLYDLWAAAFGGPEATISLALWGLTSQQLRAGTLIFAFGYLAGHIFGRIDGAMKAYTAYRRSSLFYQEQRVPWIAIALKAAMEVW